VEFLKENLLFIREFFAEFEATGSFCPTSKWAAKAMIAPLLKPRNGKRILEAGPGTGSVTIPLLASLRSDDHLVICEINPRFMQALKQNLANNPDYIKHKDRITFFQGPVQDLPDTEKFDVVICSIPFLNLEPEITESIFHKFRSLSKSDTVMTYYEYIGLKHLGRAVSQTRRRRIEQMENFLQTFACENSRSRQRIWLNMTPINVYQMETAA